MRIALVHYSAPPVIGGVERVMAQQAEVLQRHGHQVVVICGNKGAKVEGATMEYAPTFYIKRLRSALEGCHMVVVHNMFTMPFNEEASTTLAELSRELTGMRFVNWVHDVDVSPEWYQGLHLRAESVAVSTVRQAKFCQQFQIPTEHCEVIPNGVDVPASLGWTPRVRALADKHHLLDRGRILFHPTRVLARKNIEGGIAITAALRKQGVDALYLVSGAPDPHRPESADYAQQLRDLVQKLDLASHVLFAGDDGTMEDDDIRALYSLADALLFPSKAEGFGLPLLEAALHRLPVFCSDIDIHREVASQWAHFFKLKEKPATIARQISAVLEADSLGTGRRQVLRTYAWDSVYQEYLEPLLNKG